MTSQDFSIEFDLLYNNISSNQAPGLTEYEKSVFLTQAQEALILDLYKGTAGDSFETTEEVTRYLGSLVKVDNVTLSSSTIDFLGFKEYSIGLPDDILFITFQSGKIITKEATDLNEATTKNVIVTPVTQDSLYNVLSNPFKGPNINRIISVSEEGQIILYSSYSVDSYNMKYLKRPNPIVLNDSELSIEGVNYFDIEVPESLHRQILLRAVQMAKAVWTS